MFVAVGIEQHKRGGGGGVVANLLPKSPKGFRLLACERAFEHGYNGWAKKNIKSAAHNCVSKKNRPKMNDVEP